tara:strand:- start:875 stop:1210 length:336 start_codon:yes stop_codon:yes gene_type:complete
VKNPYSWAILFIICAGLFGRCTNSYKDGWSKANIDFAVRGCMAGAGILGSSQLENDRITGRKCRCFISKAAKIYSMEEFAEFGIDFMINESSVKGTTQFRKLKNAAILCNK